MRTSKNFELLRSDPARLVAHIPHSMFLGIEIAEIRPSECWIRLAYSERLVGNPDTGVVAGGVITTLLDQASGSSVVLSLDEFASIATLDLRIDYMKPATPGRELIAHAHCYKRTRNIAFVRGTAYHDRQDDPIATSHGTFMLGANRVQPAVMNAFAP